jgi:hypothetical protein
MDLMLERQIRIRKELTQHLLDWKEDGSVDITVDDEELDEVEFQAAEYRRLLPYN